MKKSFMKWFLPLSMLLMMVGCEKCVVPTVTTTGESSVTQTTAMSGGKVTSDGGSAVTERGVCWNTTATPTTTNSKTTDSTGMGSFTSSLTSLTAATKYFVRAYATNSEGTGYGNEVTFTTTSTNGIIFNPNLNYGTLTDVDGNVNKTIQIGTQIWMAENLKTTKFKDGTSIPLITDNTAWMNLTTSGFCWNNNDISTYKSIFGALYNGYAVSTGKLCPSGWHVPTDNEWTVLTAFLGGESIAGGKLKETGTSHWASPNIGATNETGFTAVPAGFRSTNGPFQPFGSYGIWWSSTEYTTSFAWNRRMMSNVGEVLKADNFKIDGLSVRCVKD